MFATESKCLMTLKGKHVLNAIDIINKGPPNIFVISKLCDGGDLRKQMTKMGRPF